MENKLWEGLEPFSNNEKGKYGNINYGFQKRKSKYRRKAYRQIRKQGFDNSEVWSLDCTIMCWLSDTFGGYFRMVGERNNWYDGKDYEKYESRQEEYCQYLDNFYQAYFPEINYFVLPRLKVLYKTHREYPCYLTAEKWDDILKQMINSMEQNQYTPLLSKYLFNLWD